jgi:hypothetical protein
MFCNSKDADNDLIVGAEGESEDTRQRLIDTNSQVSRDVLEEFHFASFLPQSSIKSG